MSTARATINVITLGDWSDTLIKNLGRFGSKSTREHESKQIAKVSTVSFDTEHATIHFHAFSHLEAVKPKWNIPHLAQNTTLFLLCPKHSKKTFELESAAQLQEVFCKKFGSNRLSKTAIALERELLAKLSHPVVTTNLMHFHAKHPSDAEQQKLEAALKAETLKFLDQVYKLGAPIAEAQAKETARLNAGTAALAARSQSQSPVAKETESVEQQRETLRLA
jgi:hypothetical protein